jgi:hypothetical protein
MRRLMSVVIGLGLVGSSLVTIARPSGAAGVPVAYFLLSLDTNDLAYDATRDQVFASIPGRDAASGNSIVSIDATSGVVSTPSFVGSEPDKLAISPDGQHLYVGLNGAGSVAEVSLGDRTVKRTMALGPGYSGPLRAEDIAVKPGEPETIVVSKQDPNLSPGFFGLVVFKQGAALPNTTPSHTGSSRIEFGSASNRLYGFNHYHTGFEFFRNTVDASGVAQNDVLPGLVSGFNTDITFAGGRIYATSGQIVDPEAGTSVGTFPLANGNPASVAIDVAAGRAYFASSPGFGGSTGGELHAYDTSTFREVGSWSIPEAKGIATSLQMIEPGRLVFRTTEKQVFFLNPGVRSGSFGEFTAVTPQRILDTRSGLGRSSGQPGPIRAGAAIDVQVTGQAGVPSSGVSAVVLNATVTDPTAAGYVSVFPAGDPLPEISNLNFVAGQTVPNLVTIAVGNNGKVSVFNATGDTHVLLDVAGYYATAGGTPGSRFVPIEPTRILDSRVGVGGRTLGGKDSMSLRVAGVGGLPSSGITAVVMNLTVTDPTAFGYVTAFPSDVGQPQVSNLNFSPGQTVPNLVVVRVPSSGLVTISNESGSVNTIADVLGYYKVDRSTERGRFVPFKPFRFFDSRASSPFPAPGVLPTGSTLVLGTTDKSYAYSAVAMNVTVIQPTSAGWLTVYPYPGALPKSSNLNFVADQTVPNAAISRLGPQFAVSNAGGAAHVLVDIFGLFT